jgi:hypothetical protein
MSSTPQSTPETNAESNPATAPAIQTARIVAGQKPPRRKLQKLEIVAIAGIIALIGAGAAVASVTAGNAKNDAVPPPSAAATLKLGYFANVTHAPALIGVNNGIIAKDLAATFPTLLEHGVTAGVGKKANLSGNFELQPLNQVLEKTGQPAVSAGGLGAQ